MHVLKRPILAGVLSLIICLLATVPASAAIAFDAAVGGTSVNSTSVSWSHTTSGSDRILIAYHFLPTAAGDIGTGCTYNSVAMTLIQKHHNTPNNVGYVYLYYLVAPATGSNTLTCSTSASNLQEGGSMSYTGASQTGQPDSFGTADDDSAASLTVSTTVVASNSWLVGVFATNGGTTTGGAGTTIRTTAVALTAVGADSNGTVSTGSQSLIGNNVAGTAWAGIVASIKEAGGGGGGGGGKSRFLLGGIGQ